MEEVKSKYDDGIDPQNPLADLRKMKREEKMQFFKSVWTKENPDRVQHTALTNMVNNVMQFENASPYLKFMLQAILDIGCPFNPRTHLAIEKCQPEFYGMAATDTINNQIVVCQDAFDWVKSTKQQQRILDYNLSHELVHMFDHCRGNVDFYENPRHTMCSEIRAAMLSGQCAKDSTFSYNKTNFLPKSHQKCVRKYATLSFKSMNQDWSNSEITKLLNEVFPSCYADYSPYDRIPMNNDDTKAAFQAYRTRNRYANF